MRNAKINDVVLCSIIGNSYYKVIDSRDAASGREVQIQYLGRPLDIHWVYEYHCNKQSDKTIAARKLAAAKILSKPMRHR